MAEFKVFLNSLFVAKQDNRRSSSAFKVCKQLPFRNELDEEINGNCVLEEGTVLLHGVFVRKEAAIELMVV